MIGKVISHYRILEALGRGGMGLVYKGEDQKLGRLVALKFLPDQFHSDRQAIQRFRREARAASALNHPNICTIYAIDEFEGRVFIAMELLEGETLTTTLKRRLTPKQTLSYAIQMADALDAAHTKGIVHRDIKPSNVFSNSKGNEKILDFGLAQVLSLTGDEVDEWRAETIPVEEATKPGVVVGTLTYMSPEQASGESVDHRTDLFSFGAVLYQMATGRLPFEGKTAP